MKIFNRVLATVLALIMTLAVFPLSALAASEPWVEVDAETAPLPGGNGTESAVVVKLDAKALAQILKDTGLSSSLLNELKSHIKVDKAALMEIITPEELVKIISVDEIMNLPAMDLAAILTELGDDVTVYFDLEDMLGGLNDDELNSLVNMDNALPVILDYYKAQSDGLAGLLKLLLGDGTGADANGDGIPDDCAVKVEMLANATFFDKDCFTEAIYDVEMEKYINDSGLSGTITMDRFLSHWPIDPNTGTYDIRFLEDAAGDLMINTNALLTKAEDEGVHFTQYFALKRFLDENPALFTMVCDNYTVYLNATAQATVKEWAKAAANGKTDWVIDDFNAEALKAALGCASDLELMLLYQNDNATVTAKIAEDPELYLSASSYNALRDSVLTSANLDTLHMSDVDLAQIREDAHALDAQYHDNFFYGYVDMEGFVNANVSFLAHNIASVLTPEGLSAVHHNIDFIAIAQEIGLYNIIKTEGFSASIAWLNFDKIIEKMQATGTDLADYVDVAKAIKTITPAKLVSILINSGVDLLTLIHVDQIFSVVGTEKLMAQISAKELVTLLQLDSVKAAIPEIITLVLTKLPYIVDEITVNDQVVAKEDAASVSGRLSIDFATLAKELAKTIPTLNDLQVLKDNKLMTFDFGVTYEDTDGKKVTKNITVEVVLEGDLDPVRNAAAKLSELLNKYVDFSIGANNLITLDIKVPAKATALYAKVLATGNIPQSIKDKLLMLPEYTGDDAVAYFENLTLDEIVTVLEKADVNALYNKFKQVTYVELVLDKIAAKTGYDLSALSLNDILARADGAIDKAGSYAIVDRIYDAIESKLGIDVTGVLDNADIDALYQTALDKASGFDKAFIKVKNYVLYAIDKISVYAPAALSASIGDLYEGNGVFGGDGRFTVDTNARDIAERVIELIRTKQSFITIPDKAVDLILDFVPEDLSVSAGLDLTVRFANLYRVTYRDFDGTVLAKLFLPKDTALSIYDKYTPPTGVTVDGWVLYGTDTVVEKVTGDIEVSPNPVIGAHNVTFLDENGNTVLTYKLLEGAQLSAQQLAEIAKKAPVKNAEAGYEYIYYWTHNWYLDGASDPTVAFDPATIVMGTEDITVRSNHTKKYFDDYYTEDNVVPTAEGYIITVPNALLENGVVIPKKLMEQAATEDIKITVTDGTVDVTVDSDTLNGFGTEYVVVKAAEVDTFDMLYYNSDNANMYAIDFLIGDDLTDMKCYKVVQGASAEFAGDVTVKVAFNAIASTAEGAARVYELTQSAARAATVTRNFIASTSETGKTVTFNITNCSDTIVVANEYRVAVDKTVSNEPDDAATVLEGKPDKTILYFPVGANVEFATEITDNNTFADYITESAFWNKAGGGTLYAIVDDYGSISFTMPAEAVDLTLEVGYKAIIDALNKQYIVPVFTNGAAMPDLSTNPVVLPNNVNADYAQKGYSWVIRVIDKTSADPKNPKSFDLLVVGNDTLKALYAEANGEKISFSYSKLTDYTKGYYTQNNSDAYDFSLKVGAAAYQKSFADVTVQLPFADATARSNESFYTRVHCVDGTEREEVKAENVQIATKADWGKTIVFKPAHFSTYAIANEYLVTYEFLYNSAPQTGTLGGLFDGVTSVYLPVGATVVIEPHIDGFVVTGVSYTGAASAKVDLPAHNGSAIKWSLVVPEQAVELKIALKMKTFYINFYVKNDAGNYVLNSTIEYDADADPLVVKGNYETQIGTINGAVTAPEWYENGGWAGFSETDIKVADMDVYLVWSPIEYQINFIGMDGTVVTVPFTCEDTVNDIRNALIIPEVLGYVGTVKDEDWALFDDINQCIEDMVAAGTKEMSINIEYTARNYQIFADGNEVTVQANADYMSTVTIDVIDRLYYKANVIITTVKGDTVAYNADASSFVMPAEAVVITVIYTPDANLMYTINGRPFKINEIPAAPYRIIETFDVYITSGYEVVGMPDYCKLISTSTGKDGIVKLTYSFEVVENNMAITYSVEKVEYDLLYIFNGAEYTGDGFPKVAEKKVFFNGWSDRVADSIVFATFGVDTTTSLVWLWILIGLLVLIGLIILIYRLYINGKLKANFITRFVTWIVNGFFGVCIFVAAVGLYLFSLFGKKEEDFDYFADEGLDEEEEDEEATEEAAEEATEETAEEATEEAAEEATEETAEEATEETAEEATEETAEEATEEATEEVVEETDDEGEKPTNA